MNPSGRKPKTVTVPNELLAMLSEEARKVVMDEAIDGNQRFKVLMEELHLTKKLSLNRISKLISVPYATLRWWAKGLGVQPRDRTAALQLANTKYIKNDFNGDEVEKLKLWLLAHTDGSVQRAKQQVLITLNTPDPYLAFLFKELFGRYGHVGVAPYKDSHGQYKWLLWVYLPLKSFKWLLERRAPASIDNANLYDVLSVAIDTEGTIYAGKRKGARTAMFGIALYNEKEYVIEPLYQALTKLGYNPSLSMVPKGRETTFGALNNDYRYFAVYSKACIKRLLEHVKLALPHKRLKAYLIRQALSSGKPTYWEEVKPMYTEVNAAHDALLTESKRVVKVLYPKWSELKELLRLKRITRRQYEQERDKFRAEAWKLLEGLKAKCDEVFNGLEERIKARFRA